MFKLFSWIITSVVVMARHKTFISYYHANDQQYKDWLIDHFSDLAFINHSVGDGDISTRIKTETIRQKIRDEFLRDSTVTLVLVGTNTWQRKHVDWEIASSIRHTKKNRRSGLVGLILPTRDDYGLDYEDLDFCTMPPRLVDNIQCEYGLLYDFPVENIENDFDYDEVNNLLEDIIHKAFVIRTNSIKNSNPLPDNSYPPFINNRSSASWC